MTIGTALGKRGSRCSMGTCAVRFAVPAAHSRNRRRWPTPAPRRHDTRTSVPMLAGGREGVTQEIARIRLKRGRTNCPDQGGTASDSAQFRTEDVSDRKKARRAFERAGTVHGTRRGFMDPNAGTIKDRECAEERGGKPAFAGQRAGGRDRRRSVATALPSTTARNTDTARANPAVRFETPARPRECRDSKAWHPRCGLSLTSCNDRKTPRPSTARRYRTPRTRQGRSR